MNNQNNLYLSIINATSEGFWLIDHTHHIREVNDALCNMLQYSKEELIGKTPFELIPDKEAKTCIKQLSEVQNTPQRTYELTLLRKDGTKFQTRHNATTLQSDDEQLQTFAFITDISQQKSKEQALKKQQQEIEERNNNLQREINAQVELNREKDRMMYQQSRLASMGEMIGNIAHQWRQPLNILALVMQDIYISGQLGTLDSEKLEKEYEKANSVLQYMSQTIDDFRNFFKHSNGDNDIFSIKESIDSVYSLVGTTFEYNHIAFENRIKSDAQVRGNQNEFKQVIINILNNAQEAIKGNNIKEGRVQIDLHSDDTFVILTIKDNGGGIDSDIINKIFDPYFTTKHQTQGTGLGLYMSKQIIETSMHGVLEAFNHEDGALFSIKMPKVV